MTRAALLLLLLAACGRVGFDPEALPDAATTDAFVARPELVQARTANDSNVSATTVDLTPTGAGGLIAIATLCHNIGGTAESVLSVTDDAQNNYVFAGARGLWNGDDGAVEIWYAANARPGASIVRISSTGVTSRVAWVLELANIEPTAPLEGAGQITDQPSAGVPAAPVVAVSAHAVVVSLVMVNGTVAQVAAGNPFALLPVINGDAAAYAIVEAPGSYGAILDAPGSGNYAAVTAAFRGRAE